VISPLWRLALVAKALLLLSIAGGFVWIALAAWLQESWVLKAIGGIFFGYLGLFVGWAASLGFADAVIGQTRTEEGVRVLANRKQGYSMRAPSGRFVEFILWNPWGKLDPAAVYRVTYGRYSGVIVEAPRQEKGTG
jgi:hypothetical protein